MLSKLSDFIWSLPLNRNVLTIVGLFVILAAIPLTVYLSQQQQELRQRAEHGGEPTYACGQRDQPQIGKPSGESCLGENNRVCTAWSHWEYVDENGQDWCSVDCANPCVPKCLFNAQLYDPSAERYECLGNATCPGNPSIGFGRLFVCNDNGQWDQRSPAGGECLSYCKVSSPTPTPSGGQPTPPGGGPPGPQPGPGQGGPTQCDDSGRGFASGGKSPGDKRYKCVSGACPYDSSVGLGIPYVCEFNGSWSERNGGTPECTVNRECEPTGIAVGQPTATPQPGQPAPTSGSLPIPTRASIPTATPIPPTPTLPAGATSLVVSVRQQLVTNPRNNSRQLEVKIFNNLNQEIKSENVNAPFQNGIFTGTLNLGNNFVTGPYVVKIKIVNTLRKLMQNVTNIIAGQTNTLSAVELISGDLNNDNELSVVDYANLVGCVELPGKPVVCNNRSAADLNDDGNVTIQDLGILISNFSHRKGD